MNEQDHAYLAAHEQSRRLHQAPPTPTVADLAHAALTEMLGSARVRPSLAGIERDRARTARTGRCIDATILASHVPALTAAVSDVLTAHYEATGSGGAPQAYCADCDQAWPCATRRALAARLDLTDPEGDPS